MMHLMMVIHDHAVDVDDACKSISLGGDGES